MLDELIPEWAGVPALSGAGVQVFALRADEDAALLARAQRLLTEPESERAARFRVERAREEFVVGRAVLRALLGRALTVEPRRVPLHVDECKKPFVPGLHCNVSHSRGLVYIALCRAAAIGIDVEWVDPALEAMQLAEANFVAAEAALVSAAPEGLARAEAFCRLWTRKEAAAKAYGRGLHIAPSAIQVPRGMAGRATVSDGAVRATFHVSELLAPPGFVAALAVAGGERPVSLMCRR